MATKPMWELRNKHIEDTQNNNQEIVKQNKHSTTINNKKSDLAVVFFIVKGETMVTGRPKKEINKAEFEKLCGLMCTAEEIASWFDCHTDTLNAWCKTTYLETFSAVFKKYSADGRISLRRMQMMLASKSATMAIFLGKQYLGQADRNENEQLQTPVIVNISLEDCSNDKNA